VCEDIAIEFDISRMVVCPRFLVPPALLPCFLATYLLTGVSAAGDDGDSADLEELHLDVVCRRVNMKLLGVSKLGGL
jgi:hypothetical protein